MTAGPGELGRAVERLRAGGLVAFPTETVYGLGADARDAHAVARVFAVKGRPVGNPLIVHASSVEMARGVVSIWTEEAELLAQRFWPGPLTLVLPRASWVPPGVTAGGATVGVRVPAHPLTLALIEAFGHPIVGPSANRSGRVSPTTAEHVRAEFPEDDRVLVLDGGACRAGIESTVVDLTGERPVVLRPGVIGEDELLGVLGVAAGVTSADAKASGPARSPGVLGAHYQPGAGVRVVSEGEAERVDRATSPPEVVVVWLPLRAAEAAAALYAELRRADRAGVREIWVVRPAATADDEQDRAIWRAIDDRLSRASGARSVPD